MQKQDAYNIGRDISKVLDILGENDFGYNIHTKVVFSERLNGSCLGRLIRDGENYIVISNNSEENIRVAVEKKRLVALLKKTKPS